MNGLITGEMKRHFEKRTGRHIDLVRKYCKKIAKVDGFSGLTNRGEVHDESKFGSVELDPYIWLTWRYKCKDDGVDYRLPGGMEEKIKRATEHHILTNSHHPEFHQDRKTGLLNDVDRDKPPRQIVDATRMPDLDIAEMVADWAAMSEERGGNPRDWADKNVNIRWKFHDNQKKLIYGLIDQAWA
jgi:hypothetical protein